MRCWWCDACNAAWFAWFVAPCMSADACLAVANTWALQAYVPAVLQAAVRGPFRA